jgi:hypothetical protein
MPALKGVAARLAFAAVSAVALGGVGGAGCKAKATSGQCDALLDRYAQLVVVEKYPDASSTQIEAERTRERTEARADDAFKNCSSEVSRIELECAMRATSADAVLKCLE